MITSLLRAQRAAEMKFCDPKEAKFLTQKERKKFLIRSQASLPRFPAREGRKMLSLQTEKTTTKKFAEI